MSQFDWVSAPADTFEEMEDEGDFWCEECQNTGSINCYCGGDLCVCENYGEMPCPSCGY